MGRMMTRKTLITILILAAVVALVILLAVGCVKKAKLGQLKMVTIAFQEFIGYGPFYLAAEKGFFKDEGVDLIFVDEQLDSARNDAFKQRMLDLDATTLDVLINKRANGVPVVAVMELDRSSGVDGIAAIPEIRTLEDLAGRRVALARDDTGETFLSVLLYKQNIPFSDIIIVPASPEEVAQSFLSGEADAAVTWEPELSKALKRPDSHLLISSKETPGIIVDMLNVREDIILKDPLLIKSVMRGWFRAVEYYNSNPNEASGIIAKYYKMTPEQYREAVKGLSWIDYKKQTGQDEENALKDLFGVISELKFINKRISVKPDIKGSVNGEFLKDLYEDRR